MTFSLRTGTAGLYPVAPTCAGPPGDQPFPWARPSRSATEPRLSRTEPGNR
ncbi:hypothetical protein [Amycolatopsis sp. PS_44_ISF1]|uniref:hypothetical protein n=1 Tax=Amycolatopsis sp. PS_44_ISF1 TaxID=2974917 RepID=UPI0028DF95CA|nr:hypothetical protein [Amycolatopsis sp. PS_44_ISF1]MDT8915477.1 hypothetical protein [Amycolatopsis sp. PS_44_ISF1]